MGVSVAALSTRPFGPGGKIVHLPKPTEEDLNRFMLVDNFMVGETKVVVVGLHLEWFGDPTTQTEFVVE
jgi:hypothetical protein